LLSAALLERWPQVCRVKVTFTKLLTNRFVSTTKISMNYVVNWIPLRIRVRSRKTQPHLKFAPKALFNGAIPKLNFLVSGRISVVIIDPLTNKLMSTFLRNQDDSTMDLTELAVAMGSPFF